MSERYLEIDGVTKCFGSFTALSNVSLDVARGEFVTFLGPSGSGKTTTLMIIAGFEQASSGNVRIGGRSLGSIPPHARNIGIVFQNYALFPHKNARDNVCFPLQMRSVARGEAVRRAEDMLSLVGLKGLGDRFPKELSGGQQQRVALARALVFEPSLLLLDEPLGALDKSLREQMQIEIKRIQRTLGVTTIFVTHDQSEAMSMSDRIVVFDHGRVEQVDTPLELYRRPRSNFVAGFIGESNLIPARVGGDAIIAEGFGRVPRPEGVAEGEEVTLLVRPEDFEVTSATDSNSFEVTVGAVINYGDVALVVAERGSASIRMKMFGSGAEGLQEGATLRVGWTPEAVHVIRRSRPA